MSDGRPALAPGRRFRPPLASEWGVLAVMAVAGRVVVSPFRLVCGVRLFVKLGAEQLHRAALAKPAITDRD
jgi:hypothetical protein